MTRPSTQGIPRLRQTPPGPRIPQPRPPALVYSPPPSLTPTTSYLEDSTSLPAHEVSPYTTLLPYTDEICLSSDDEGKEKLSSSLHSSLPVSLPALPAGISISRVGQVTSLS